MSSRKNRTALSVVLAICGIVITLVVGAIAVDTLEDRQRTLTFEGSVRVFENDIPLGASRTDIVATLHANDRAKVLRIWYGKDYECVKIQISDGRVGYLISGESGIYTVSGISCSSGDFIVNQSFNKEDLAMI
jgi:hypothetical protein